MISIQPATPKDLREIRHLLVQTWIGTYRGIFSRKFISKIVSVWHNRKLLKEQIMDPRILFNTAKNEKGKIVGVVSASRAGRHTLIIRRLYVHPRHHRKRIGIKLMNSAIASFRNIRTIRLEVIKENRKARYFYLRHGFKMSRTQKTHINGRSLFLIVMQKRKNIHPRSKPGFHLK